MPRKSRKIDQCGRKLEQVVAEKKVAILNRLPRVGFIHIWPHTDLEGKWKKGKKDHQRWRVCLVLLELSDQGGIHRRIWSQRVSRGLFIEVIMKVLVFMLSKNRKPWMILSWELTWHDLTLKRIYLVSYETRVGAGSPIRRLLQWSKQEVTVTPHRQMELVVERCDPILGMFWW